MHLTRAFGELESFRLTAFGAQSAARIKQVTAERARREQLQQEAGLVYYAEAWGHIKIGTTTNISSRMADLKVTRLLATEPGSYAMERHRHRQFAHLRAVGEYFLPDPELVAHTEALCAEHGPPITDTARQLSVAEARLRGAAGEHLDAAGLGAARLAEAIRPRRPALRAR